MQTSATEEIITPDAGDGYALTQHLLAMADSIDDAFIRLRANMGGSFNNLRGSTALRDAAFAGQSGAALANSMPSFFNTDHGWWERYFVPVGTSGLGVRGLLNNTPAGWYPVAGSLPHANIIGTNSAVIGPGFWRINAGFMTPRHYSRLDFSPSLWNNGRIGLPIPGRYRTTMNISAYMSASGTRGSAKAFVRLNDDFGAASGGGDLSEHGSNRLELETPISDGLTGYRHWVTGSAEFDTNSPNDFISGALRNNNAANCTFLQGMPRHLNQWRIEYLGPTLSEN